MWYSGDDSAVPRCNASEEQDPRTEAVRYYCYGVALPTVCVLGILGNVLNLVVLTRRNMKGTAYIYMRGTQQMLIAERIHKFRAKAYFDLLKQEDDEVSTFSSDCQKNIVLPQMQDPDAYYSKQLYMYNFTIVQVSSKTELIKQFFFNFVWSEKERPKDLIEIVSAVYSHLCTSDFSGVKKVKLFSDGCCGQNKNSAMVGMCSKWLATQAPPKLQTVEMIFPVPGHSFIPPDRVSGLIEKEIRMRNTIIRPEEYFEIYQNYGKVIRLGIDVPVHNWKYAAKETLKSPGSWYYKFKASKRIILERSGSGKVLVQGEAPYRSDVCVGKTIVKRGKSLEILTVKNVDIGVAVNEEKVKDVANLLMKHFSDNWKEKERLVFYKNVISQNHIADNDEEVL